MTVQSEVKDAGRKASASTPVRALSRIGLVARGAVYVLVGLLAVQVAFGRSGRAADRQGALQTVAQTRGGAVLLWLLAAGFAGLVVWSLTEAAYGAPGPGGRTGTKRLGSLARAVLYTAVCASTVAFGLGSGGGPGSSDRTSKDLTGRAMHDVPGGRWLVLLVGTGIVIGGVVLVVKAVRRDFAKWLKTAQMSRPVQRAVEVLGVTGHWARAAVFAVAGGFLCHAAVTFDPGKAQGTDGTLREFARTSAGPWLLVLIAAGLIVFGLYSFCEARWRRLH